MGLTPPLLKLKPGKRQISEVLPVLQRMYDDNTRVFGLCEISDKNLLHVDFIQFLLKNNLKCKSFYKEDGKAVWDIAFVYDENIFQVSDFAFLNAETLAKHKKLAVKIDGTLLGHAFRFYVSHFPGQRTNESKRIDMFKELITRIHTNADFCPYSLAMGDYNIEVCSHGLINSIARSREHAIQESKLFTPFFKHIGEKYEEKSDRELSGTIKIGSKWELFDFISVTRHFFHSDSKLQIDDFQSGIWDELFTLKESSKDHLPVYVTISTKE